MMEEFNRIKRLPPYVFNIVNDLKAEARGRGEDVIDLGMGNPDQPTPPHVVDKAIEAIRNPKNHRYSASKGIYKLRHAISQWYKRRYDVDIDPDSEAVATIGSKEGLAHLALAILGPGDVVCVPTPTYPIHAYSVIIAGGDLRSVPLVPGGNFLEELEKAVKETWPRPKLLILNFPHNPTTSVVDRDFFVKVVEFAHENKMMVIHDLAYADIVFDGYEAPSFLSVPGAKEVGVEFFTLSKSYSMPGWRVGFAVGNPRMIGALTRIKSYLDYGMFQPIQIASIIALNGPQECVEEVRTLYGKRRDVLVDSFTKAGWEIDRPKATMFVWARLPEEMRKMGSLEFSKFLLKEAGVAVSPGIGFGERGDEYVRLALVENSQRIRQAAKGIKKAFSLRRGV
ncbi:MAG: alanine transaminase [Thermodesulfobacteriota bacterium]